MMTPQDQPSGRVQVTYQLEQNDEWPPVGSERLWAIRLSPNLVRIESAPWFVQDISLGDIVRTTTDPNDELRAVEKISWSGNCTVRVIPFQSGPLAGSLQAVLEKFSPLDVYGEGIEKFGMVALTIPLSADAMAVKGLLIQGFDLEWWDYEESCVGEAWHNLAPR
ncbi:DUF4265 domain-containing protein [Streptomyces sp. So13.3]|uniref:DUF4265 domain-containing protein n=1 Tax=unclassified Streptomyces TaxID=2593676 RepID=UPI0011075414|nr:MULTISPECIES: DUF4265 domain-containing protein [unclassified Streptomyces]NEA75040.1 DUF4265 domain-containing protein [Streptomyces sp. SID13588]QNA73181.1 DUF4265 domain-containing protein [Streptomyces sp. So13.3]